MSRRIPFGKGSINVPWNSLDRAIEWISPEWAGRRLQQRVGHALVASMGGYHGGEMGRRSLSGWDPMGGDADSQVLPQLAKLRERSRDLERNSVGGGAINTTITHVVGTGLSMQSRIDAAFLGISDDAAEEWQNKVEREFELWAGSEHADSTRHQNFYEQQSLALRSVCAAGDHLIVFGRRADSPQPVKLALQHVEADRVCNPSRAPDRPGLVAGVQMDAQGAAVIYHVASANPSRMLVAMPGSKVTWQTVPVYGGRSRRRTAVLLFERLRAGQTRGVPMLAPVIEPLKQLERYTDAELMAAVVSGMFTVFIKQDSGAPTLMPSAIEGATAPNADADKWDGKLGNGLVVELGQKESIESANPGRPNATFDPFVTAIIRQIGLQLQIPYEVLVKHYTSSYSAARAALLDAWRFFRTRREWLAAKLCQPVYEAWLDEAVASGRIDAPGYWADPLIRAAWASAEWIGDGPGAIDPYKEAQAARERVSLSISTLEAESIAYDGVPWDRKMRQRAREKSQLEAAGLPDASSLNQPGQQQGAPSDQSTPPPN